MPLKKAFGNMDLVKERGMVDSLVRGLIRQPSELADGNFADDVSKAF